MFQQTIQDALTLTEADGRPEDLLERVAHTIHGFERFEAGEILAETPAGLLRFVITPGLAEIGPKLLDALGDEPTFRIDTREEMTLRGLTTGTALASVLSLRLEAPGVTRAAIVLAHPRAWSFAATPLSRLRNIGSVALRLLLRSAAPTPSPSEVAGLKAEVARLQAHTATLENEVVALRADRAPRQDSDKPR